MPVDLSSLTEEEIAELKQAIENPPVDPVKTLASVMDLLIERLQSREQEYDALCSRVDKLESFIEKDLIGGVMELSSAQEKAKRISGLKGSYGTMFEPYDSYIKEKLGDTDFYEELSSLLDTVKDKEGYDEAAAIKEVAEEIGKRVAEITGKPVTVEATAVESAPAEEAKAEEPESDGLDGVRAIIAKLKAREDGIRAA